MSELNDGFVTQGPAPMPGTQRPVGQNPVREHWMAPLPVKPEAMPPASTYDEMRKKVDEITALTAKQMGIEPKDSTDALIQERKKTHGDWMLQSKISQELKAVVRKYAMYCEPHQVDALEMIAVKMSRILGAGDPSYADHWDDIAGYARLGKQGHQ